MKTTTLDTVGKFFQPRFESITWVEGPDTSWRTCNDADKMGELLNGVSLLQLVNIISSQGPIARIEIANTPERKGTFLFDRKGSPVAHIADAQAGCDDINMTSRLQVILSCVDVTPAIIDEVGAGIAGGEFTVAIISREPQEGLDDDILTKTKSDDQPERPKVLPVWKPWFPR